jgi:di/tricarboxylate transporter
MTPLKNDDIDKVRQSTGQYGDKGDHAVALAEIKKEEKMHERITLDHQHEREIRARTQKDVIISVLFVVTLLFLAVSKYFHMEIESTAIVGFAGLLLGFLVNRNTPQ